MIVNLSLAISGVQIDDQEVMLQFTYLGGDAVQILGAGGSENTSLMNLTSQQVSALSRACFSNPLFSPRVIYLFPSNPPHSSVGSLQDLRTGGRWFNPRLGQNSFQGLMIVIATGYIPLSLPSIVFHNGYS